MRNTLCIYLISFLFLVFSQSNKAYSNDSHFDPWSFSADKADAMTKTATQKQSSPLAILMMNGVHFFRDYISEVDGDRCLMYPSCTSYSLQSIERHGFFMGYLMTVDRLIHESNEMGIAPVISIHGETLYFDPIENNDFWWNSN